MAIRIGQNAPDFTAQAVTGSGDFTEVSLSNIGKEGKWTVLYFYPLDFTFVCPTEIRAFNDLTPKFAELNTQVLGVSTDSHFSHKAWLESGTLTDDKSINHPIVADFNKTISRDYGVLNDQEGFAFRGTVIIDPKGNIRFYTVSDAPVGRNADEIVRTLQALQYVDQAGGKEVCPVNWAPGSDALKIG